MYTYFFFFAKKVTKKLKARHPAFGTPLPEQGFIHIFFVYFKVNFGDTPT